MKKEIKINDDVKIDLYEGNYVVKYRKENKTDKAKNKYRWEVGGYFVSLEDAVLEIVDQTVFKEDYLGVSLTAVVEEMTKIKRQIVNSVKKYESRI